MIENYQFPSQAAQLLADFENFWLLKNSEPQKFYVWLRDFEQELKQHGVAYSQALFQGNAEYEVFVQAILSAKYGYGFNYKQRKLVDVAHIILEHYPKYWIVYRLVAKCYGHLVLMEQQDQSGKLLARHQNTVVQSDKLPYEVASFVEFLAPKLDGRLLTWCEQQQGLAQVLEALVLNDMNVVSHR